MPFTEIKGKKIFYSWKPASRAGLTLFFIHGLGGAHSFWSPVIPGLVESGFSCLAIDVPGACSGWSHSQHHSHTCALSCSLLCSLRKTHSLTQDRYRLSALIAPEARTDKLTIMISSV